MASGSEAADLRLEREGSAAAELRHFPDQSGRDRAGAGDVQRDLRWLPDVLSRRAASRVRFESQRENGGRDQCLSRRLGELDLFLLFLGLGFDLPVVERLRSGTNVGNVRIDARGQVAPIGGALGAIGETRGLVVALRNAGLLALPLV